MILPADFKYKNIKGKNITDQVLVITEKAIKREENIIFLFKYQILNKKKKMSIMSAWPWKVTAKNNKGLV